MLPSRSSVARRSGPGSEIERLACVLRAQSLYFLHTFDFRDVAEIQ